MLSQRTQFVHANVRAEKDTEIFRKVSQIIAWFSHSSNYVTFFQPVLSGLNFHSHRLALMKQNAKQPSEA